MLGNVLARGEGNPFFIEELVRAGAHGGDDIPGDVLDVLGARIDRLAADDRDLLRIGAVIGHEFSLDLVEEVAGGTTRARAFRAFGDRGFCRAGARRASLFVCPCAGARGRL